ncbi:MAG: caspase family protein, partial [Myxococcota bacterium]
STSATNLRVMIIDVLGRVGQVPVENLVVLLGRDANTVERVLTDINTRIARFREANPGSDALLVVYYSGHADTRGIHLTGTRMPFARLRTLMAQSAANLRVMIIDACRSGSVTRVKGGRATTPFTIDLGGQVGGEGMAIITSAAAGEDAQESERLSGSFFTHHLVSGLLGAADVSGDRRVTLGEIYDYAYHETIRSTSRAPIVQHPTYDFQIRGRQDLVMTELDGKGRGMAELKLADGGHYVLFQGRAEGPVMAEFSVDPGRVVAIRAGRYLVRRRGQGAVYEEVLALEPGAATTLESERMRRVPYGRMVRKGIGDEAASAALGVIVGGGLSGPITPDTGAVPIGLVGLQLDLEPLTLQTRIRYGQASHTNDFTTNQQRLVGGDLSVLKLFDRGPLAVGFGFRAGVDWLQQQFGTPGVAPSKSAWTAGGGLVLHLAWTPLPWMSLYTQVHGDVQAVEVLNDDGVTSTLQSRFVPHGSAGIMMYAF